jgi:hypothetical protein
MTDLTLETRLQRNPEQIFTDMDGDTVMLNVEQGSYFGIGGTGNRIWELLAEPQTAAQLVTVICNEFEVEKAECESDVVNFCQSLLEHDLAHIIA